MSIFRLAVFTMLVFIAAHNAVAITIDTTYIKKFHRPNQVRLYVGIRNAGFKIEKQNAIDSIQDPRVSYTPNARSYIGVGISLWQLGISLSVRMPESQHAYDNYGLTNYRDLNLTLITRRTGGNIWYRNYEGLFLSNPETVIPGWQKGDPMPQRRDITYKQIGGDAYWVFNTRRFSVNSSMKQSELQVKSAGSLMLLGEAQSVEINSDSTLIPSSISDAFSDYKQLRGLTIIATSLCIGYAYNFVFRSFFLNPCIFVGPGFINQQLDTDARWIKSSNAFTKIDLKLNMGLNMKRSFVGLKFGFNNNISNCRQLEIQNTFSQLNIFGGFRF